MTKAPAIYCALDRPDLDGALALARTLDGVVDGFKLGLEFVTANGPGRRAQGRGARAAGVPRPQVPRHPQHRGRRDRGGARARRRHADPARRRRPRDAARRGRSGPRAGEPCPRLIGVTVLTSLDDADLAALGIAEKVPAHVAAPRRAGLGLRSGRHRLRAARGRLAAQPSRARLHAGRPRHPTRPAASPATRSGRRVPPLPWRPARTCW